MHMQGDRLVAKDASRETTELQASWVKRIRTDSKKLGRPTNADDLAALAPELDSEEISTNLTAIGHGHEYEDIKPLDVLAGARYLFSDKYLTEERARRVVLRAAIARKVREDTENLAKPIIIDALSAVSPTIGQQELREAVAEVLRDDTCPDIKRVVAFTGAEYLFSETYLSEERAEAIARAEELQFKIVVEIRGDSKYLSKLTRVEALEGLAPDIEPGEIEAGLAEITENDMFADIGLLTARDGVAYAFSGQSMTRHYAELLLRIEANDPCYTIVETVRENSRVYPRPTNIEHFKYGLYGMDRNKLDEYIARTQETYEDIKLLRISGTVWLYSDTYMNEDQAEWAVNRRKDG